MVAVNTFPGTQKLRVICGPVSIYTTAMKIRNDLGDFVSFNEAVKQALSSLENTRSNDDVMACATGLGGTFNGIQVQIDMAVF